MVKFGVSNVPNLAMFQIYLGQFGTWLDLGQYAPNLTMSQIRFGHGKVWDIDHPKSKFWFGMYDIKIPIWDIPGLIWDMVEFGLQQLYRMFFFQTPRRAVAQLIQTPTAPDNLLIIFKKYVTP